MMRLPMIVITSEQVDLKQLSKRAYDVFSSAPSSSRLGQKKQRAYLARYSRYLDSHCKDGEKSDEI
jgi:hypothetical protein